MSKLVADSAELAIKKKKHAVSARDIYFALKFSLSRDAFDELTELERLGQPCESSCDCCEDPKPPKG